MSLSANAHRSASQSPPVTPPRPTTNNPACRPNDTLLRRHILRQSQHNTMTPQTQSLAQANARLIHERLQQHHTRLQVQLHAQPHPPTSTSSAGTRTFLDTTFRTYASRIQTEFNALRAACARAVQREQHKAAAMRGACARLAHERDAAEEKLRVLRDRRARAGKRTRAQVESEDAEAEFEYAATGLLSPVSPPQLPTQSPPPRLLSPFVLAARRSPRHTPDPEDRTGFDLTVSCDAFPRPSKRRRVSGSSERTFVAGPESESTKQTTKRETCPPAGFGECDMDLESDSESGSESDTEGSVSSRSKSPQSSRAASSAPPASSAPAAAEVQPSLKREPTPPAPAPAPSDRASLDLQHIDIMYLPADGKLVCRPCLLAVTSTSGKPAPGPIQAFGPGASWDMLRTHCEAAHPEACRDVVGLGQAGVRELRRRLGLGAGVQA
ncbi:hypothetical protein C8R44DRAFT_734983 [Mycena epipterygia]|nr:hypothetical protein C8R44DRAFT_734983 [Mycena epipterygia]